MQLRLNEEQTLHYIAMQALEEDVIVNAKEKLEYPPVAISYGENLIKTSKGDLLLPVPIGTYGNFSFVQSPPKSKKTFFISLLTSIYLGGTNNFGGDIKGHRDNKNVIHIDTEQGKWQYKQPLKMMIYLFNIILLLER